MVNGIVQQRVTCGDAIDCQTKCERFARSSRDGGLGPENCALCDSICPTNFGTTITDGVQALAIDVGNAVRLIDKCFAGGFGGCVCNIILALAGSIDFLPTPQERCSGGNIFGLLASKILELSLQSVEDSLNLFIVKPINSVINKVFRSITFGGSGGPRIPKICLTGYWKTGGKCFDGDESFFNHMGCYNTDRARAQDQCYFFRQRAICGMEGGENRYGRYQALFTAPSGAELEAEYQQIAGSSYTTMHPTLASLIRAVDSSSLRSDAEAARNICDESIYESMDLDEIIVHQLHLPPHRRLLPVQRQFGGLSNLCPANRLAPAISVVGTGQLCSPPSPPPPPGLLKRRRRPPSTRLLARSILQASQSTIPKASRWPSKHSTTIFGPWSRSNCAGICLLAVSAILCPKSLAPTQGLASETSMDRNTLFRKYEMSMAFMASESFEDKNSISARMIQARLTNFGRFSCMAMLEFASEADNAAAGTAAPASARFNNPSNYNSPYDRNWLLYFATIFTESLQKEVGGSANFLEVNVLEFWQQQCEEPASFRAPVPSSIWSADRQRLGTTDAFDTSVEVRDFAPLVSFGSLRQLRSANGAASEQWPEDATTSLLFGTNARYVSRYGSRDADAADYGRRAQEAADTAAEALPERSEFTDEGIQYRDANVSITTGDRPAPSTTRRGRGLLINFLVGQLIKSYLLNSVVDPYKQIQKQYEFEIPASRRPHFYYDTLARQTNIAKDLLRDVFCNPDYALTIEQAVGNPPPHAFSDTIVDSSTAKRPKDMVVYGNMRGGDVNRGYEPNGPGGAEPKYKDTTTQSWVYVTSSDDPNVKIGFHRLADLRIWPDTTCDRLKSQPCGSVTNSGSGSTTSWLALAWFQLFMRLSFGRRLQSSAITYVKTNDYAAYAEPPVTEYRTGIEALLGARCSNWLASRNVAGAMPCLGQRHAWYATTANGCFRGRLQLFDTSVYVPRATYLSRFSVPDPPPAPPPRPPPPAPPAPPPPSPSPSPPNFATRDAALDFAARVQRDFCDSVYILSAETRCNALAKELHVQFQLDYTFGAPALPPIAPEGSDPPPPPPSPPSPRPPLAESRIIRLVPIYAATLSTYFLPQIAPSPPPYGYAQWSRKLQATNAASQMGVTVTAEDRGTIDAALASGGSEYTQWAACTQSMATEAFLPCRTSGAPFRCLDGARHCGTVLENTHEPFVELDFHDYKPDYNGRMYLFLVHFKLPPQEEYARLLFHPLDAYGGDVQANRGWRLTVYDDYHHELPVQCQDWNYGSSATEYTEGLTDLHHLCLKPTAIDEEYEVLSKARFLRITLIGEYRQVWVDQIDVYFRAITDVGPNNEYVVREAPTPPPSPLPAPSVPPDPPAPPAPPPAAPCTFYAAQAPALWETFVRAKEPCGLTATRCCELAHEHNKAVQDTNSGTMVDSFVLSSSGCCSLLQANGGASWVPANGEFEAYQGDGAGTGILA